MYVIDHTAVLFSQVVWDVDDMNIQMCDDVFHNPNTRQHNMMDLL